jgi:flavin-dependent dehydrogenase
LKTHFTGARVPHDEVQLFPFRGGYCGLIAVENGLANACLLTRYDGLHKPEELWQRALHENKALAAAMQGATPTMPWRATANVSFGKMEPVQKGVLRCGDAAGYIQPFAGDGQAMAARGGELAAACLGTALRGHLDNATATVLYDAAWRREFEARLSWGARLQPLMLAPRTGEIAAQVLRLAPQLARLAARRTRGF